MNDRMQKLEDHLRGHPTDYTAVIALYKLRSDAIEHAIKERQYKKLRRIAECRRILNEQKHSG